MGEYMNPRPTKKEIRARRRVVREALKKGLSTKDVVLYVQEKGFYATDKTIGNDAFRMGGVRKLKRHAHREPRTIKPIVSVPKRAPNLQLIEDVITSNLSNDAKMLVIEKCFS